MKQKRHLLVSIIILFTAFVSCRKDSDTSVPKKINEEILTSKEWKINEIRGVQGNSLLYYKRGTTSNSQNLDNESVIFKADKTGVYTNNNGSQQNFTWSFSNSDQTKLVWTVQFTPAATITWEIYSLTENSLKYIEYFTQGTINIHGHGERIPK